MIDFDPATRTVTGPTGSIVLTPTHAAVLGAIPAFPDAIRHDDLLHRVWGVYSKAAKRKDVARVTVYHLRGRLADVGFAWSVIHSEYRVGYSLRVPPQQVGC